MDYHKQRWRVLRAITILFGLLATIFLLGAGHGSLVDVRYELIDSRWHSIYSGDMLRNIIFSWMPYFLFSTIEMFYKK